MAKQTFTAGQVLTAAQVNALQANDYNQTVSTKTGDYVLVAADKGTRVVMNSASAQTITVDTDLFNAGDTLFIQNIGAGVCTITAGTATVSTAGSLALAQNAGGTLYFTSAGVSIFFPSAVATTASGLTLISATTVGSAVASVTVSSAFSSTYANYKIMWSGGSSSDSDVNVKMILGATSTAYYSIRSGYRYAASAFDFVDANNGTAWTVTGTVGTNTNLNMELLQPNLAKITLFNSSWQSATGIAFSAGYQNSNTQFTAFTLTPDTGTLTGGVIRVYGYTN
jgi:hypothetical protein